MLILYPVDILDVAALQSRLQYWKVRSKLLYIPYSYVVWVYVVRETIVVICIAIDVCSLCDQSDVIFDFFDALKKKILKKKIFLKSRDQLFPRDQLFLALAMRAFLYVKYIYKRLIRADKFMRWLAAALSRRTLLLITQF